MASQEDTDQSKHSQKGMRPNGSAPGGGADGMLDSAMSVPGDDPQTPAPDAPAQPAGASRVPAADTTASDLTLVAASGTHVADTILPQDNADEFQKKFLQIISDLTQTKIDDASAAGFFKKSGAPQQSVIARLIILAGKLSEFQSSEGTYRQAYFAARLLMTSKTSAADTVLNVLDDIEFRSSRNSPIYSVMRGLFNFVWGFFFFATAASAIFTLLVTRAGNLPWDQVVTGPLMSVLGSPIIVSGVFGILGSMVSILLRLSEFEGATRRSRQFLTMTGSMLPLVGGVFACVTYALFASGLINFNFAMRGGGGAGNGAAAIDNLYFYIVVGFLSGFSERFTRGLLGTAENTVSASLTKETIENADGSKGAIITARQSGIRRASA